MLPVPNGDIKTDLVTHSDHKKVNEQLAEKRLVENLALVYEHHRKKNAFIKLVQPVGLNRPVGAEGQ